MMRTILILFAVSSALLFGACSNQSTQSPSKLMTNPTSHVTAQTPASYSYRSPGGAVITLVRDKTIDEFAEIFHARYWRFDIKSPKTRKKRLLTLEWRHDGKRLTSMVNILPLNSTHYQCLVVLAPNGESMTKSDKMKCFLRVSTLEGEGSPMVTTNSLTMNNLLSNCIVVQSSETPIATGNGNWILLSGWKTGNKGGEVQTTSPADSELVFRTQEM